MRLYISEGKSVYRIATPDEVIACAKAALTGSVNLGDMVIEGMVAVAAAHTHASYGPGSELSNRKDELVVETIAKKMQKQFGRSLFTGFTGTPGNGLIVTRVDLKQPSRFQSATGRRVPLDPSKPMLEVIPRE